MKSVLLKRGLGLVIVALVCNATYAQSDVEALMTRQQPNCHDLWRNGSDLLPKFHSKQQVDSVNAVIEFWEERCGEPEALLRFKVLLAIEQQSSFIDSVIEQQGMLQRLMDYKSFARYAFSEETTTVADYRLQEYNESIRFTEYTVQWAKRMLNKRTDLSTRELFFLRIYSHDFDDTFTMLKQETFNGTAIQQQYNHLVSAARVTTWFRGKVSLGGWFPSENLSILGDHVGFGIGGGVQHKRWHGMVSIGVNFGNSPQAREVYYEDSLYVSDVYNHVSLSLDLGYTLYSKDRHNFELLGGVGYNGVKILEVANPIDADNPESIYRNALLLNAGLGYRYDFPTGTYLGLSAKYNFTHFDNRPGADLTGNFLTIHVALGLISQDHQRRNRQLLDVE